LGVRGIERPLIGPHNPSMWGHFSNPSLGEPMLSPEISHALLSIQKQETLSVPTAALILGALSQVENLIELAERVCDPVFRRSTQDGWSSDSFERSPDLLFTGMLLTLMTDAFDPYRRELERVTVPELDAALQRIAEKIFAPVPPAVWNSDTERRGFVAGIPGRAIREEKALLEEWGR
jgi:hypothetical protein